MIGKLDTLAILVFWVCCSIRGSAQTNQQQVSSVFAVLTTIVDSKSATEGQEVRLRTARDLIVRGQVVIPANSIIVGHVSKVIRKAKDNSQSAIALVMDKAVINGRHDLNIQGIIAAVAAPGDKSLASDPTSAMMRSNEPKMTGNPSSTASSGELSASSKANSGAAVAAATLKGDTNKVVLDENSQGAIGYEGLSISWSLSIPPPMTIITAKRKDVKLAVGTQALLRIVPPEIPR